MTGGRVAILGPVGDNFGAGMTGGLAFVWDPDGRFESVANPDAISWRPVGEMPEAHVEQFRTMLELHAERTGSRRAERVERQATSPSTAATPHAS